MKPAPTEPTLIDKWIGSMTSKIPASIAIQPNGTVAFEQASAEEMAGAGQILLQSMGSYKKVETIIVFAVCDLINEFSAEKEVDRTQAMDDMGLTQSLDRKMGTLQNWCTMNDKITPAERFDGLLLSHYMAATAFRGPDAEDMKAVNQWNKSRREILEAASKNPDQCDKEWVKEQMKALQQEMGIESKRTSVTVTRYRDLHIALSRMLLDWSDEEFAAQKIERSDARAALTSVEDHLSEKGALLDTHSEAPALVKAAINGEKSEDEEDDDQEKNEPEEAQEAGEEEALGVLPG